MITVYSKQVPASYKLTGVGKICSDSVEVVDVALESGVAVRRRRLGLAQPLRDHGSRGRQRVVRVAGGRTKKRK